MYHPIKIWNPYYGEYLDCKSVCSCLVQNLRIKKNVKWVCERDENNGGVEMFFFVPTI